MEKLLYLLLVLLISLPTSAISQSKQIIKALYIPLADHYAGLVAYERYHNKMQYADFQLKKMKSWDLLRAYFRSGKADMAYIMAPLAMDMYNESPNFRWIGLMHRDGNALAINEQLNFQVQLPEQREKRKPDAKVAQALKNIYQQNHHTIEIALPHLLSTHGVVLYSYLKQNGLSLDFDNNQNLEVSVLAIAPPKSPSFLKSKSNRAQAAAFEQSLPWADVVETEHFGYIAWYSKDVLKWKNGHVECIVVATDEAINSKYKALYEVRSFINRAAKDIENAREKGGQELEKIVEIIRKHIPSHTRKAILASLDPVLKVINYQKLNIDKAGLKQVMDLALEAGILKKEVDIDQFADTSFDILEKNYD
ncbi:MAG: ABC transporter substrate-binding protein [Pseudomonadota bacterium]